jgi:hypothetical protein
MDRDQWREFVETVMKLPISKRREIVCVAERLLASRKGFCCVKLLLRSGETMPVRN